MKKHTFPLFCFLALSFQSCKQNNADGVLVSTIAEFDQAVAQAGPGDVIILSNGVWENAELLFQGKGTKEKPITLTVEKKGKVTLEGLSNLRIAGSHLVVSGLVFKNGYTPTSEVISFKKDKRTLANHCRLTECVIDTYNNPERHESDTWVAVYGRNNRVDHNHLAGKRNRGVTMTVRLNTKESQENNHRIDHNYFGPRQTLGSNGGETLRIGTSHYSLSNSKTLVEANYFDRCDGEHEIISNKSCQNIFRNNVFYECTGTLTMRHGNETLVEGNVFIGNNKPGTGGIRVINGQQTVRNNYGIGLKGYRFRGALVVMNGVPNSPLNRYFQVEDARIENNTFINCDHVQLCAGSDAERSAVPVNSLIANNIFYNESKDYIFTVYDDISGITFKNNVISPNIDPVSRSGFTAKELELDTNESGLLIPQNAGEGTGAHLPAGLASRQNTGVNWYPKDTKDIPLSSGKKISVSPGLNTLFEAAKRSLPGDVIEMEGGTYTVTKSIAVAHPLTFKSAGEARPVILFEKGSLFEIENGGSLSLEDLVFDGSEAPDRSGNSVIATSKYSMNKNYKLFIDHCEFVNLDVNHSYDAIRIYKNTFADTISIRNSKFENISGNIVALDKETDDTGIYNAEYVIIRNNSFTGVGGAALRLYRGGKDESTFGPFLQMEHNVFDNVGNGQRNQYNAAVSLYGVQEIAIKNNIFNNSKGVNMHLVVGEPIVYVVNNNFFESGKLVVTGDQKYTVRNLWSLNPDFANTGTYVLGENSPLKGKGTDGSDLGVQAQ